MPAIHGVVRWRLMDLVRWLAEEHGVAISVQTLSRELRALGLRKLSARPQHYAQKPEEQALLKGLRRLSGDHPGAAQRHDRNLVGR